MTTHINRGIYSCGDCGELGHTRDTCERARPFNRVAGWKPGNEHYQVNRALGACDACGRPSKRFAYCKRCRARKAARPSRQRAARRLEKARAK